jgi:hypothetical protein
MNGGDTTRPTTQMRGCGINARLIHAAHRGVLVERHCVAHRPSWRARGTRPAASVADTATGRAGAIIADGEHVGRNCTGRVGSVLIPRPWGTAFNLVGRFTAPNRRLWKCAAGFANFLVGRVVVKTEFGNRVIT